MAFNFKVHKVQVAIGGNDANVYFRAPEGSYTGLADVTGVEEAPVQLQEIMPCYTIRELLEKRLVVRLVARSKVGGKVRTRKFLVSNKKVATAPGAIIGEQLPNNGGVCESASYPISISYV